MKDEFREKRQERPENVAIAPQTAIQYVKIEKILIEEPDKMDPHLIKQRVVYTTRRKF